MMKKLLFTLAIALTTLTSCESDLVSAPSNDNIVDGVLLKSVVDSDGITTQFTYVGNKLIKFEDNDVSFSETFTYTGELLTQVVEDF